MLQINVFFLDIYNVGRKKIGILIRISDKSQLVPSKEKERENRIYKTVLFKFNDKRNGIDDYCESLRGIWSSCDRCMAGYIVRNLTQSLQHIVDGGVSDISVSVRDRAL